MSDKKPSVTGQKRAGLNFSVSRVKRIMNDRLPKGQRHSSNVHVAFAAVLEYVTAEILEMAIIAAKNAGRKRITPRDIFLGTRSDEELSRLFKEITIKEGGVIPRYNRISAARYAKNHKKRKSQSVE